jgi:hypothetical protein
MVADKPAVRGRRADEPAGAHDIAGTAIAARGERRRLRDLAVRRARGRPDVSDPVPAFDDDEDASGVVASADVDGA